MSGARRIRVATITSSDTRTPADDEGGRTLRGRLEAQSFDLAPHAIVREDEGALREHVERLLLQDDLDAITLSYTMYPVRQPEAPQPQSGPSAPPPRS